MMSRACGVLVIAYAGAASAAPGELSLEAGPVTGIPQSSLDNLDAGFGVRVILAYEQPFSEGRLAAGGFVGVRQIWTGDNTFGDDVTIWTREYVLGGRVSYRITPAWFMLADIYAAGVNLDSRSPMGTDSTWHHNGVGGGVRVGAGYVLHERWRAVLAVGESYAETHYDDSMGVAWLSLDAAVVAIF